MMSIFCRMVFLYGCLLLTFPQSANAESPPAIVSPVLKRVVLSTGGVGYFEYQADIAGPSEIQAAIPLKQVDDILKSLVVYDPAGQVADIRLPGKEPLQTFFQDQRFNQNALGNPVQLLNTLRGAEIAIDSPRKITGRLMAILPEQDKGEDGKQTIIRNRITVMTDQGVQQVILEQIDHLRFIDPALNTQLDNALKAVFNHNARDRRLLRLSVGGAQKRQIRFGYVIEVPLWKTSYRLTPVNDSKAALQGWAVLENISGVPWDNIDLSLVSGNPVALRQALYDSYFLPRPQIPLDIIGRIIPQIDQGSVAYQRDTTQNSLEGGAARQSAPMMKARMANQDAANEMVAPAAAFMAPGNFAAVPETSDVSAQIYFHFPHPVSVDQGGSITLPIIQREIPARTMALFQPATHPRHPLSAIKLANQGEVSLPPGLVTFYDRDPQSGLSFGGDAQMATLPAGDERILTFALDQKISIDQEQKADETVTNARFVDGILYLSVSARQETIYRIKNIDKIARSLVIEQQRQPGWNVVEPTAKSVTLTEQSWRIMLDIPAGQTIEQKVVISQPTQQQLELTTLNSEQLRFYASSQNLSAGMRTIFARLAELKADFDNAERQQQNLELQKDAIVEEQERLRRLLGSIPSGSDLYKRYMASLNIEEDHLQDLRKRIDNALQSVEKNRSALLNYAREQSINPKD